MSIFMRSRPRRRSFRKFQSKRSAKPSESERSVDCSNIRCGSLEVECFPQDLPDIIRVDVTNLNIGEAFHVRDIKLPDGVESITDGDLTAISVVASRVGEEPAPATETPATPEVITEKRADAKSETPSA